MCYILFPILATVWFIIEFFNSIIWHQKLTITRKENEPGERERESEILLHKIIDKQQSIAIPGAPTKKTFNLPTGMSIYNFNSIFRRFSVNCFFFGVLLSSIQCDKSMANKIDSNIATSAENRQYSISTKLRHSIFALILQILCVLSGHDLIFQMPTQAASHQGVPWSQTVLFLETFSSSKLW